MGMCECYDTDVGCLYFLGQDPITAVIWQTANAFSKGIR